MDTSGIFYYYCAVHPDMRGTLNVGDVETVTLIATSDNPSSESEESQSLEFTATSFSDTSITGGELPLTKIKSVGNTAYIIDGTTPKGGHDAFSYDSTGHKKITGNIQVDLDPVTNTGTINAEWTDPEGNQWKYQQTKFAGGNEMYIGETIDGVTQTKLDLDPPKIDHNEKAMSQKESHASDVALTKMSPRAQMKHGIEPSDVQCRQGFELIMKNSDGSAACINSNSVEKLKRGWGNLF